MVIELVKTLKKGAIHFLIQRIVFRTGCMEKFGLIDGWTLCVADMVHVVADDVCGRYRF